MAALFRHALNCVKVGLERGDPGPAVVLFKAKESEAKRNKVVFWRKKASEEAQELGKLIASFKLDLSILPAGNDPPPIWQTGKKRVDPLAYMRISGRQEFIINEIRFWHEVTVRALFSTGSKPMDVTRVDQSSKVPDPMEKIARYEGEDGTRWKRYLGWTRRQSRVLTRAGGESLTATDMVLLIIIDRYSFRSVAKAWRADEKRLRREFREALDDYLDRPRKDS